MRLVGCLLMVLPLLKLLLILNLHHQSSSIQVGLTTHSLTLILSSYSILYYSSLLDSFFFLSFPSHGPSMLIIRTIF